MKRSYPIYIIRVSLATILLLIYSSAMAQMPAPYLETDSVILFKSTSIGKVTFIPNPSNKFILFDSIAVNSFFTIGDSVRKSSGIRIIQIIKAIGGSIQINNIDGQFTLLGSTLKSVSIDNGPLNLYNRLPSSIFLMGDSVQSISISGLDIQKIQVYSGEYASFRISQSKITGMGIISFKSLPNNLSLSDLQFSPSSTLKIDYNYDDIYRNQKKCKLQIRSVNVDNIEFQYLNFELSFEPNTPPENKIQLYQKLLEKFSRDKLLQSYENIDKEYKEFIYEYQFGQEIGAIVNLIDRLWWDYGYNKFLVIRGSAFIFFLFFVVNIFWAYPKIIKEGYAIDKFEELESFKKRRFLDRPFALFISRLPDVFLYTGLLFWGIRLDINKINIKHFGWFLYVILQYVVGVICLAYVANYFITK